MAILSLFTMWVLIINTDFATAEPGYLEMQKFPQIENFFVKKECLIEALNLGSQKLFFDLYTYH